MLEQLAAPKMPPVNFDEAARLEALHALDILDTPSEERFDSVARLIQNIFDVDIGIVSLIDAHRQWYKACAGFEADEVERKDSFCQIAIQQAEPLVIPDALNDDRFRDNIHVEGGIRSYAGMQLRTREGFNIGTLCAVHSEPREFSDRDIAILADLSRLVMDQLELRQTATTDALTGVLTRRGFRDEAEQGFSLARRHGNHLSCITLDLDHFKRINDTFGHAAGDLVLRQVARTCLANLRKTDHVGRMGGEEFALLLPHTDGIGAMGVSEKIRTSIEAQSFEIDGETIPVTASLGVATLTPATPDLDQLLANSDRALYIAKNEGRNRSIEFPPMATPQGYRERVLKSGRISHDSLEHPIDCTVRTLGKDGAGIDVFDVDVIPEKFLLTIESDELEKTGRIIAHTDRHIEIRFV